MIVGEYLSRVLMVVVGYAVPAYHTYKAVSSKAISSNRQEQLRVWCIYWLVLGFFMTLEWLADVTIFWLPMYYEAKLAFVVFCWHPRTQGAVYLFDRFVQPLLHSHEGKIDQVVEEAKARVADMLSGQLNRAKSYMHSNTGSLLEQMRTFSETAEQRTASSENLTGVPGTIAGRSKTS